MTVRDLQEWRAYADLEPFDEERDDLRAASIVTALYNIFTRKKGDKPHAITEFVLPFGDQTPAAPPKQTKAQTVEQIKAHMRELMIIHNTRR